MYFGKVVSAKDSPTPSKYLFLLTHDNAKKNMYVTTKVGNTDSVGRITNLTKSNQYFEKMDSLQQFEKTNINMHDKFPVTDWEYALAEVKVYGTFQNNLLEKPVQPPSPGEEVRKADDALLSRFLGFPNEGLSIGNVEHHNVDVKLDTSKLFQKHLAVLAQSGFGKSYAIWVLLEELMEQDPATTPTVIVFDFHGEYVKLAEDEAYKKRVKVFDARDIKIDVGSLTLEDFQGLSYPQRIALSPLLNEMRKDPGSKDLNYLIEQVNSYEMHGDAKDALLRKLSYMQKLDIYDKQELPSMANYAQLGHVFIINFKDVIDHEKRQIILSSILRKLFSARLSKQVPPFIAIIEEAHNFAEQFSEETPVSVSRQIIEKIAREGRKFGASICLISQRPSKLSSTALSQCASQIILRISNPNDLAYLKASCEGLDEDSAKSITSFGVGDAVIIGEVVGNPLFLKIRQKKSKVKSDSPDLTKLCTEFHSGKKKLENDAGSFM